MNSMSTLGTQVNTDLARAFRTIVTAGWGNLSDGDVSSPVGHFAIVHIEPAEMAELVDAVFDGEQVVTIYPGSYLVREDSDGNTELIEYLTLNNAMEVYNVLQSEYSIWNATCPKCGDAGPHSRVQKPNDNTHGCACGQRWDPITGEEF